MLTFNKSLKNFFVFNKYFSNTAVVFPISMFLRTIVRSYLTIRPKILGSIPVFYNSF